MAQRWIGSFVILAAGVMFTVSAQGPPAGSKGQAGAGSSDLEFIERLQVARRDYQKSLESLRTHYLKGGDLKRAKWAEEELRGFHRVLQHAYRPELDPPHAHLQGKDNVVEANRLYTEALKYKDKGWGSDYQDNQRRAELLFQKILTHYPHSNKISDTAYQLGDIYESKAYKMFERAAVYFERCYQWNPLTQLDARMRAARLYDRQLNERGKAIEVYREVTTHETDPKRLQEATKRLADLAGQK